MVQVLEPEMLVQQKLIRSHSRRSRSIRRRRRRCGSWNINRPARILS
jgi:hypothetical protein